MSSSRPLIPERSGRERRRQTLFSVFCMLLLPVLFAGAAQAFELKPFKDRLFAYPGILESRDGGAYLVVDYDEQRDINRRDKVPERRVNRAYVDPIPRRRQADQSLQTDAGEIRFIAAGISKGARLVTVYVHGRGGDRKQGANDYTFGGNFNRIKNLMLRNSGVYITPDGGDLDAAAATRIRELVLAVLRQLPGARAVIACGSAGGAICHALAQDQAIAARMAARISSARPPTAIACRSSSPMAAPILPSRSRRPNPSIARCARRRTIRCAWSASRPAATARRSAWPTGER
jgi:hypothetical protein